MEKLRKRGARTPKENLEPFLAGFEQELRDEGKVIIDLSKVVGTLTKLQKGNKCAGNGWFVPEDFSEIEDRWRTFTY